MSRDPYRSSTGELGRTDRWDRDRFVYERDRERDRFGDTRERVYEEDDHVYTRGPPPGPPRRLRPYDDDVVYQSRRRDYYDDSPPRFPPRRPSPPGSEAGRRVVFEKEREREVIRSPSPPRRGPARPGTLLRRQSSLDTFDRRPRGFYEREEYGPPARREDFRPPINTPIPLPRHKALPPPRRYAEREYYDEIRVSDPDYYGDDAFHDYPERVREKEIIRTRRRSRSRESRRGRARSPDRTSRSSSRTSVSSSSSEATTTTARSEYPKKGKTRIPARLVSKRALIDLNYPFVEEGNTIVVQRALGQENIDDLLKLSEDYKKAEVEVSAARSQAGDVIEERRQEVVVYPAGAPAPAVPAAAPVAAPVAAPATAPVIVNAAPAQQPVEVINTTTRVVRDPSPARTVSSYTTDSYMTDTTYAPPYVMTAQPQTQMAMVPAVVETRHRSRSRHHRHSSRDLVKAERLPNGELVLFEETVERVEEPNRGVRIEKDKRGPPPKLVRAMLATLT